MYKFPREFTDWIKSLSEGEFEDSYEAGYMDAMRDVLDRIDEYQDTNI